MCKCRVSLCIVCLNPEPIFVAPCEEWTRVSGLVTLFSRSHVDKDVVTFSFHNKCIIEAGYGTKTLSEINRLYKREAAAVVTDMGETTPTYVTMSDDGYMIHAPNAPQDGEMPWAPVGGVDEHQ